MSSVTTMNAAVPQPNNQVQVSSELRTIKAKINELCNQGNAQETVLALPLAASQALNFGTTGLALAATATPAAAKTTLGMTTDVSAFNLSADLAAMKAFLGIAAAAVESIDIGSGVGTCYFPGGFMMNWYLGNVASGGGQDITWKNPFQSACFGVLINLCNSDGTQPARCSAINGLTGAHVKQGNGSAQSCFVIEIGV